MHEAGLAIAVADALRREEVGSLVDARVRVLVSGGHAEPEDFDGAFRLHLSSAIPELDPSTVEIVHLPLDRVCIGCGGAYAAASADVPCPRCGGSSLPIATPERVEVEVLRPDDRDP